MSRQMRWCVSMLVGLLIIPAGLEVQALAQEAVNEQDPVYLEQVGEKLNRGVVNTALGWTEIPKGIQSVGKEHGVGAAATWGILHGLGRAIQRTAIGVFEIVTFPLEVPRNFEPIFDKDHAAPLADGAE